MSNKKSQVQFIVIILIILMVIVGAILFWNIFSLVVRDKSAEIGSELLSVELDVEEAVVFVHGSSKIEVHRGAGGELDGLKFAFYDDEGDVKLKEVPGILNELETKTYSFGPVSELGKINKVSVFPVFEDRIGREFASDEIDLFAVPPGMVSWWRFDDLNDFAGENHGSFGGSVNGLLVLNGGNYFSVPDNESLDMDEGLTISAWVKSDSDNGGIVGKGGNYNLALDDGKVVFSFSDKGIIDKSESVDVVEGGLNHVAVSAGFDGVLNIYVNGEIVKMKNLINKSPDLTDLDVKIGEAFVGEIDEVMIFDEALSSEQVGGLYEFGQK